MYYIDTSLSALSHTLVCLAHAQIGEPQQCSSPVQRSLQEEEDTELGLVITLGEFSHFASNVSHWPHSIPENVVNLLTSLTILIWGNSLLVSDVPTFQGQVLFDFMGSDVYIFCLLTLAFMPSNRVCSGVGFGRLTCEVLI